MQRYKILHRTYYNFPAPVRLEPHVLRLRPKEGHELHIESSTLDITPPVATLRWQRDVEDNSVAIATFNHFPIRQLRIESEVIIQQYNQAPLDFLVEDYAAEYPFAYQPEDKVVLAPYMAAGHPPSNTLATWVATVWQAGERIQTYTLLQRLGIRIQQALVYQLREEPGVQSAAETLSCGTGSCRDAAYLFMEAARSLGFAARFVSGYLHAPPTTLNFGATHAWAEVFLPGAGWKGFDPTIGAIAGVDHIAVAVARLPTSVPPVSGTFVGLPGASLNVGVWVTALQP